MTNEAESDADSLMELGKAFCVGYLGHVMVDEVETLRRDINDRLKSITKLLPYLSGMFYVETQRQFAEMEIFRLQTEIAELIERVHNSLVMAPDLGRPVTINYT
jgi:hypothetical protein